MIGRTISHYRVVAKLGAGGMGAVYRAIDQKLERPVALKFLPPHAVSSDSDRNRFLREARSAAALSHPAICTVHEIDEADDQIFIAMEYVDGQSLAERIAAGPLAVDEAVGIAIQIAEGLQEAHGIGFVHRDIKPANIMITTQGRAVILDFGLVRSLEATSVTKVGIVKGTTAYLSPEQVRGQAVDQRADIWALGVVLYEMLTGRRPFQGEIDQATIYLILQQEPTPLLDLVPETPASLSEVVARALTKGADSRYQYVEELLDDLLSIRMASIPNASSEGNTGGLRIPSIAVLPFANLTGDPEREYFCDGIAEELIMALSRIRGLRVVARTSSFAFKGQSVDVRQIGATLDVVSVLEGSVRVEGTRVRIAAQLIGAADGCHLWSQRFERELTDIFALQDEIALATVSYLKPKLAQTERRALLKRYTDNVESHDLLLKAYFFAARATGEDIRIGIKYLERAIAEDPDFALAHCRLAALYGWNAFFNFLPYGMAREKAATALSRALELDDTLAEAHAAMGTLGFGFERDLDVARKELEYAQDLEPDTVAVYAGWSGYHAVRGDFDAAFEQMQAWERIDPLSIVPMIFMIQLLITAGRWQAAREHIMAAFEFAPELDQLHWLQGEVDIHTARYEEGLASIRKAVELSGRNSTLLAGLGWALAVAGRGDEARAVLGNLLAQPEHEELRPHYRARIYSALGDFDRAFACLERTYAADDHIYLYMAADRGLINLRSDPRWNDYLVKWGVPH